MKSMPQTFGLMQQQKNLFGNLTAFVFDSGPTGKDANKEKHVTSALIQMHAKATGLILLCGLMLLSLNEQFGEAISCLQSDSSLPIKLIERYCWFEGNFVFYDATERALIEEKQQAIQQMNKEKLMTERTLSPVAYPGVSSNPLGAEQKFALKYN